ncbi:MAG: glycosyltransferase family 39 protein [Lachnospiraceae bacterium]|nr:glycosyltransferase family 39 protein [Lachnospiraceae bacterium]
MELPCIGRRKEEINIFIYAIAIRLVFYLISVCMMAVVGDYPNGITFSDFLDTWQRWDSSPYLRIAENGYRGYQENGQFLDIVFYPLYPWLIRIVEMIVGEFRLAGIVVSTICFGIGSVYFHKLVEDEFGKEEAENGYLALLSFPFAFFFGAIMTESLFFALSAAFLYYLRKHKWGLVCSIGFLACLTKIQGILLALAVLAELFFSEKGFALLKSKQWKEFGSKILIPGLKCVPMIGGVLVYLFINYLIEGDIFRFMYYQQNHWNHTVGPFWETVRYSAAYAADGWYQSTGMGLWVPQFVLFFVLLGAIIYGFRKKLRPTYLVYLIAYALVTYSSTWLISGGRYTLSTLPLFMLAGRFFTEHKNSKKVIIPFSFALMMVYLVGYYQWKQIM